MPVVQSTVRFPYDALTVFRAHGSAALTADAGTTAVGLDIGTAYWDTRSLAPDEMTIVVDVEAITAASHSYLISVEFDDDGSFGSGNTLSKIAVAPTATGQYVMVVPKEMIPAGSVSMRLYCDVTGSTPSITFAAWLVPTC